MKKCFLSLCILLGFLLVTAPYAKAISLNVDNTPSNLPITLYNSTSYVPLRAASELLCPNATISWENQQAIVTSTNLHLIAQPGNCYLDANGRMLYIQDRVKLVNGSTLVPIRVFAKAIGATVTWNNASKTVLLSSGSGTILSGDNYYDSASVYWLSRIIHAESEGEPLAGKIAVGNVILNRVKSSEFPNTIYHVIFDTKWGVQFEPTRTGTIYHTPSEESLLAAQLCLDGASVVGNSIYFLAPTKATNLWIVNHTNYIATIGQHQFYE